MPELKPSDVAKILGVSVKTIQRWDNNGFLTANRNLKGRRYYTIHQIVDFKKQNRGTDMGNNLMVLEICDNSCEFFENLKNNKGFQHKNGLFYSKKGDAFVCSKKVIDEIVKNECIVNNLDREYKIGNIYIKSFVAFLDNMWEEEDDIVLNFGAGGGSNSSFRISLNGWGEEAAEKIEDISELSTQDDWYIYITLRTRDTLFSVMLDSIKSSMRYYKENI